MKDKSVGCKCPICGEMYRFMLEDSRDQSSCPICKEASRDCNRTVSRVGWEFFEPQYVGDK